MGQITNQMALELFFKMKEWMKGKKQEKKKNWSKENTEGKK